MRQRRVRWILAVAGLAFAAGIVGTAVTSARGWLGSALVGVIGLSLTLLFLAASLMALERRRRPGHNLWPTIGAALALVMVVLSANTTIVGFLGGISTEPEQARPSGSPLEARLDAYLDPRWAAVAPESEAGDMGPGSIAGGLVVVDVKDRSLRYTGWFDAHPEGLAEVSEQVRTVALVWHETVAVGDYTDGATGWRHNLWVRVVDLASGKIVGDNWLRGGDPPSSKSGAGDRTGVEPDLVAYLDSLRPVPSPTPGE